MRNFEIAVRGPFDIAERMCIPQTLSPQTGISPIIGSSSPSLVHRATITTLMRQNSININPHHNYQPSHFGLDSVYSDENRSVFGNNSENTGQANGKILLNHAREDQCWDVLFMICGGTGLTPMLQLVSNFFKNSFYFITVSYGQNR